MHNQLSSERAGASFGARLRAFRIRAGLSQEALAEQAGLGIATLKALEQGQRQHPRPTTLVLLADALGLAGAERAALLDSGNGAENNSGAQAVAGSGARAGGDQATRQGPHVPVWLTSFVGRERELERLRTLLDPDTSALRLLTLLGPGGVGKTRLAVEAASDQRAAYPDGVVFVDLASVTDARLVPATIARALEVRERAGRSARDLLLEHLRSRRALLVLDNLEHLRASTPLLAELLRHCSQLKLLTTSRAALQLHFEHRFNVEPLAMPPDDAASQEEVATSPAVQLFVDRAQAVRPDFILDPTNSAAIVAICRRVDGTPLAIELAAARIGLLRPTTLLQRLERRLPLLTHGAVDLPARQQTLRQTLAWSYDLLGPGDQLLFRRLAVFAGGWTLEAAETVCADVELPSGEVLDRLQVLLDSSLAHSLPLGQDEPRFGLLETVREYALERLEAVGETAELERRHLAWCLALAESVLPLEPSDEQMVSLVQEQSNLRAALRWSIDAGEVEMALRLGVALYPLWYTRGLYTEGRAWLAELLALPGAAALTAVRAKALAWAGHLASVQGMLLDAQGLLDEGLTTAQQAGDALAQAVCTQTLGTVARRRGALAEAEDLYQQSLAFARSAENTGQAAWAAYLVAYVRYERGDAAGVRTALTEAVHRSSTATSPRVQGRLLRLQAWLAALDGDDAAALAFEEHSLSLLHRLGDQQGLAFGHLESARRALDHSDVRRAAAHLAATLTIARATGDQLALAQGLEGVAQAAATVEPDQAARLLGTAAMLRQRYGLFRTPVEQAWLDRWLAAVHRRLGEMVYATLSDAGQREPPEHAVDRALAWAEVAARPAAEQDRRADLPRL